MQIHGGCHCGNITFALDWRGETPEIAARACGCSFCVKHGGVWTADPASALTVVVRDPANVSPYEFGTRTATFHICARCGAVPFVSSAIAGRLYAVVNVNTFENVERARIRIGAADFEGEDVGARLARRTRNWIGEVRIDKGNA